MVGAVLEIRDRIILSVNEEPVSGGAASQYIGTAVVEDAGVVEQERFVRVTAVLNGAEPLLKGKVGPQPLHHNDLQGGRVLVERISSSDQVVVAAATRDGIGACSADDDVPARAADQDVRIGIADQEAVADAGSDI